VEGSEGGRRDSDEEGGKIVMTMEDGVEDDKGSKLSDEDCFIINAIPPFPIHPALPPFPIHPTHSLPLSSHSPSPRLRR